MNESQKKIITELIKIYSQKANITSQDVIDKTIFDLTSKSPDEAIDSILISLNELMQKGLIKQEDIFSQADLIFQLNPEKYKTVDDLIDRFNWIRSMNLEYPIMSLSQNHELILRVFHNFNLLLQNQFDCYYLGGVMGYIATNNKLERYHNDLDLFINEEQLLALKQLVDSSEDFEFVSGMNGKKGSGHEYKIIYKGTEMSIGLFLFERGPDQSIITKEYYYDEDGALCVDEHHCSKEYTEMTFSNQTREYNGAPYKMMSLESIYNSKKCSRLKDKRDAELLKDYVDMLKDYQIDVERRNNYDVKHKKLDSSIIHTIETEMASQLLPSKNSIL